MHLNFTGKLFLAAVGAYAVNKLVVEPVQVDATEAYLKILARCGGQDAWDSFNREIDSHPDGMEVTHEVRSRLWLMYQNEA